METEKRVELLAPAGNYESFLGAVHAGADAVYLGGEKFGARAYADNFTKEQLCSAIRYAHLYNRKVYLTLNTLVKEREMSQLYEYLSPFYEEGLDGVIIQDIGVFLYVKEHFPKLSLHVSTQMAITGAYGAEKLKQLGAERIVPARELSLEEVHLIKEKTGIEIETFIHGAMCYCYSGQCLFSSILGGRSGNRGKCAQPCRLPYKVGGKEAYYLSLKDMCTIEMLPQLIEAGIDSFKIEGRMKKPEYTAGVTALYRKYIDRYYQNGKENYAVGRTDMEMLKSLYIRSEIQDGYYNRHNGAAMVTVEKPSYSGSDEKLLKEIRERYIEKQPRIPVRGTIFLRIGEPAEFHAEGQGGRAVVKGAMVQEALKQPATEESIKKQLLKCGGTPFRMEELSVEMEENLFLPLKELNELRRKTLDALEEHIREQNGFTRRERKEEAAAGKNKTGENGGISFEEGIYVLVQTKEQLAAVERFAAQNITKDKDTKEIRIRAVFAAAELFETVNGSLKRNKEYELAKELKKYIKEGVFAAYPYVMRSKDYKKAVCFCEEEIFSGILVRNMEELSFLQSKGYGGKIVTDAGLYLWNQRAAEFFLKEADLCTAPLELNRAERRSLKSETMQIVYGRIPMMITANCIQKTSGMCLRGKNADGETGKEFLQMTDRMGKRFPVYRNCLNCYNVIYNSVPLSLHKETAKEPGKYRLDFTTENGAETEEILSYFCRIYAKGGENPPYREYTTGHEKRGVD